MSPAGGGIRPTTRLTLFVLGLAAVFTAAFLIAGAITPERPGPVPDSEISSPTPYTPMVPTMTTLAPHP